MNLTDFLTLPPWMAPLNESRAWLEITARSGLLLATAWLTTTLMRRLPASARHLIWALAVVGALLLPVFMPLIPALPLAVLPAAPMSLEAPESEPPAGLVPASDRRQSRPSTVAAAPLAAAQPQDPGKGLAMLIGFISAGLLAHLAIGLVQVTRIARRARPAPAGDSWLRLLPAGCRAEGIRRPVRLLLSDEVQAPFTCGGLWPLLVVPSSSLAWSDDFRHQVLIHELSHIRRLDWPLQLASRLLVALQWYNPLAWIAARQLDYEAERCCDDRVLLLGGTPSQYAQNLLSLADRLQGGQRAFATATSLARRSHVAARIRAILDTQQRRTSMKTVSVVGILAAGAIALSVTAAGRLVRAEAGPIPPGQESWPAYSFSDPLLQAAYDGDLPSVQRLLNSAMPADRAVAGERTPLILAAWRGHYSVVHVLLQRGADPNLEQAEGKAFSGPSLPRSPLTAAARGGHADVVDLLLRAGARADVAPPGDPTPLMEASARGHLVIMEQLRRAGASVNRKVDGDGTALIAAAEKGHLRAVQMLVESGADVDAGVEGDGNPLIQAAKRGHYDVARYLLEHGANPNAAYDGDGPPLLEAISGGHEDVARLLVERGANPNQAWPGDGNPLIQAARSGHRDIVQSLLDAGADPNAAVEGDGNALIAAAAEGHLEVAQMLVARGANVNAVVRGDENPLINAARKGRLQMAALLLDRGADINARIVGERRVYTALGEALRGGHQDVVQLLRRRGAVR